MVTRTSQAQSSHSGGRDGGDVDNGYRLADTDGSPIGTQREREHLVDGALERTRERLRQVQSVRLSIRTRWAVRRVQRRAAGAELFGILHHVCCADIMTGGAKQSPKRGSWKRAILRASHTGMSHLRNVLYRSFYLKIGLYLQYVSVSQQESREGLATWCSRRECLAVEARCSSGKKYARYK